MLVSSVRQRLTRRHHDDGFTLIELLVTVTIMGVIASALAGIVISYFKHTVNTQSRMTESLELQFVTAYWQRDVSSIGIRDFVYDDPSHSFPNQQSVNVAACPGAASLTPVITLAWSEYDWELYGNDSDAAASRIEVKVTYGTRGPSGDLELVRVRCGSEPDETAVADHLIAAPTVACLGGGVSGCNDASGKVPTRITLTLSVRDPDGHGKTDIVDQMIEGERRQS